MNWIYWNTFWSLFVSLIWFMTIVSHPDSVVVDRHPANRASLDFDFTNPQPEELFCPHHFDLAPASWRHPKSRQ